MRKIFTLLLLGMTLMFVPSQAQEIDESFAFVDEEGEFIENGATITRNVIEMDDNGNEVINANIYVMNLAGSTDYLKMIYDIQRIDNGYYQICYPATCTPPQVEVGHYETEQGLPTSDFQNIMSEWFPVEDGECVIKMTLELIERQGLFPPTYVHKAYGPTITVRFVKGEVPGPGKPGDVNGDGEVNIADVNAIIDMILVQSSDKSGDVNNDGEVNISDVNAVIDVILSNS